MNKRFTYLVTKYLDTKLNKKEKAEFDKFLLDPTCSEYLKKAEKVEKFIEEGFRLMNERAAREEAAAAAAAAGTEASKGTEEAAGEKAAAAAAGKKKSGYPEPDDLEKQVKEDIIKYGGLKNPETVAAVKRMHENMLKHNRNIRWRIFGSVVAVILIGIAIVFLLTSMTSP